MALSMQTKQPYQAFWRRLHLGLDISRTVYSPVSLSMLTWVTCMGFVGVEMVGLRGEPSMLLTKLEKAPFFLPLSDLRFFAVSPSSE